MPFTTTARQLADIRNRGDLTRERLLQVATEEFALHGFAAVSTRTLAERAGVNQALIAYHFKNKAGLYLAVFETIVEQVGQHLGPLAHEFELKLQGEPQAQEVWLAAILQLAERWQQLLLSPQTEHWAQLILREQAQPGKAFDLLYHGFMERILLLLVALLQRLRPQLDASAARMQALGILGQIVIWRAAREGALRLMGWSELDNEKRSAICASLRDNLRAQLISTE